MCAAAITTNQTPAVAAIAVACGAGERDRGCMNGPTAFKRYWTHNVSSARPELVWQTIPQSVFVEARAIAGRGTGAYGVSLDLDAIDAMDALGVGTPELGGIRASESINACTDLTRKSLCIGVEIAEYNPHRDRASRTARLTGDLMAATIVEKRLRWAG